MDDVPANAGSLAPIRSVIPPGEILVEKMDPPDEMLVEIVSSDYSESEWQKALREAATGSDCFTFAFMSEGYSLLENYTDLVHASGLKMLTIVARWLLYYGSIASGSRHVEEVRLVGLLLRHPSRC